VTLELLHLEYLEKHPDGYRYTQFCERYREWLSRRGFTMRQEHLAGEKLYVDYAGKKAAPRGPEDRRGHRGRAVRRGTRGLELHLRRGDPDQRGPDFIASHVRTFRELGGVPLAVVPDQLKSGVTLACRYEPGIQRTYEDLARHYGTTVLPARPLRPRGQGEGGGRSAGGRALDLGSAAQRDLFFPSRALNERIAELRVDLNTADAGLRREQAGALPAARQARR